MNIKEYIESGILELYANQLLSPVEMAEVEVRVNGNLQIQTELEAIQASLEAFAILHSVEPPADMLSKLENAIDQSGVVDDLAERRIPENAEEPVLTRSIGLYRAIAVAASILLFLSIGLNVNYYSQLQSTEQELADIRESNSVIAQDLDVVKARLNGVSKDFALMSNPANTIVKMTAAGAAGVIGHENDPRSIAAVVWNQETEEAYMNVGYLPEPSADEQYQLWAIEIIDGEMKITSGGVFDPTAGLIAMKNVANADLFAVTLEPRGGSVNPTIEKMYVAGKVASS